MCRRFEYRWNLEWYFVIVLDKRDFLRSERAMTIHLIVIACVFCVFAFVVGIIPAGVIITKPMIVLKDEMASAACMELDAVDMQRPRSSLKEIGSMQVSFLHIVKNLVEYCKFLPVSVLTKPDEDEGAVAEPSSGLLLA